MTPTEIDSSRGTAVAREILIVEDNPGDVRLTTEAFKKGSTRPHFTVARDGVEALAILHRETPFAESPRPDLILLDLNLPRKDGWEVLREIKRDFELKAIPVVILTSSDADRDVAASYRLGANSYIAKPVDLGGFNEVVQSFESYWLSTAKLPLADGAAK